MERSEERILDEVKKLVDQYRDRCLWFLRVDYYPENYEEILRTLDYISRHGDLLAFRKAGELRKWYLQNLRNRSTSL